MHSGLWTISLLQTVEQGDSTATVIATMIFMTSAHQCRVDNLVLPIFYHCIIMLSCRLYSLLPLSKYHVTLTDCYPHCSVFTVDNCTKTLLGCGVSYNN